LGGLKKAFSLIKEAFSIIKEAYSRIKEAYSIIEEKYFQNNSLFNSLSEVEYRALCVYEPNAFSAPSLWEPNYDQPPKEVDHVLDQYRKLEEKN
jgi:hypothetical protein